MCYYSPTPVCHTPITPFTPPLFPAERPRCNTYSELMLYKFELEIGNNHFINNQILINHIYYTIFFIETKICIHFYELYLVYIYVYNIIEIHIILFPIIYYGNIRYFLLLFRFFGLFLLLFRFLIEGLPFQGPK